MYVYVHDYIVLFTQIYANSSTSRKYRSTGKLGDALVDSFA